jgi:hypothetical protein
MHWSLLREIQECMVGIGEILKEEVVFHLSEIVYRLKLVSLLNDLLSTL